MISRYEAYMDGNALSRVHPDILILDISHAISDRKISASRIGNRKGTLIIDDSQDGSSVTISFALRVYSISKRQEAMQEVLRWASGRVLETNDRPGQRLYVRCIEYPVVTSALQWTETITMSFKAFEYPFWEEKEKSSLSFSSGTSGNGTLFVPGNAGNTVVEVVATPAVSADDLSFTVGSTTITVTDCGATAENPLVIAYDENGFLSIKVGTTSVLDKRTGSDDLLAECGQVNDFSFIASESTSVVFSARGLWM